MSVVWEGSTHAGGPARARRLRRPSWRDPRLLVGVALVLASVVLGAGVVARADDTVGVYAASDTLVAGSALSPGDLREVRVRMSDVGDRYVLAADGVDRTSVMLRTVGAGELLPHSAVGTADQLARRPVTVPVAGTVPEQVRPGGLVDVWITRGLDADGGAVPTKELTDVEVGDVAAEAGGLTVVSSSSVDIMLDDAGTAVILAALADGDRIDLVPVPGSGSAPS